MKLKESDIKEFHLFAGIGGGIYGGELLGHYPCAGVEIDQYCKDILKQRQQDGWMPEFPIYDDITKINGYDFKNTFDILCGGFPCQAFSHAAHGKNIKSKNLWNEMLRFTIESDAPIVFGENVTLKAITTATKDLEKVGYTVEFCKVSCGDLGGDHRRDRYWLLAIKSQSIFNKVINNLKLLPNFKANCWTKCIDENTNIAKETNKRAQLKAVGNAQSPFSAATAFRILANRHYGLSKSKSIIPTEKEFNSVFTKQTTWIKKEYGENFGYVHTPTTMANYSAPSMMKHLGCRNFVKVFGKPTPANAEYLIGFPKGASSLSPQPIKEFTTWKKY